MDATHQDATAAAVREDDRRSFGERVARQRPVAAALLAAAAPVWLPGAVRRSLMRSFVMGTAVFAGVLYLLSTAAASSARPAGSPFVWSLDVSPGVVMVGLVGSLAAGALTVMVALTMAYAAPAPKPERAAARLLAVGYDRDTVATMACAASSAGAFVTAARHLTAGPLVR